MFIFAYQMDLYCAILLAPMERLAAQISNGDFKHMQFSVKSKKVSMMVGGKRGRKMFLETKCCVLRCQNT